MKACAPSAPRFSYRQLTEAQVLGARDRSKRQVECHQLVCQLTQANEKWKRIVDHKNQTSTALSHGDIYHRAIVKAFVEGGGEPDDSNANSTTSYCRRELSPIMIARLANLCYHEYYNEQISKGLRQTEEDCRSVRDWYSELLQNEVSSASERQRELEEQIETTKEEILQLEKQRNEQMEKSKVYYEQQLVQYKEHLVVRLQQRKEQEQQQKQQQEEQKRKVQQQGTKGSISRCSNSLGSSAGSAALQQYQKLLSITSHRNLVPKNQEVRKQQQDVKKEEEEEKEEQPQQSRLTTSTSQNTRQLVPSISNDSSFSCCDWVDVVDSENEEDEFDGDYNNIQSKSANTNNSNNNNNCGSGSGGGSDNNRKDSRSSSLSDWIVCS